jgi:hypothetical protein
MIDPVMHQAIAAGLSIVLAAGALSKLRDTSSWFGAVESYDLLPAELTRAAGLAIVGAELAGAALLLSPSDRAIGAFLCCVLLSTVTGAVIANLLRGRAYIYCGCGDLGADQRLSWALVLRNFVLIAGALIAAVPALRREVSMADQCFSVAGGLAFAGLYATANQILATEPRTRGL